MLEIREMIDLTYTIYNKLADEESKKIYISRILYNFTKDKKYMKEMALSWKYARRCK